VDDDLRDRLVAISATIADRDDGAAQAMIREILKAPQAAPAQEPVKRVFIVATGEEHEGEATYTRYDDAPPPLCDSECLYATPQTCFSAEDMATASAQGFRDGQASCEELRKDAERWRFIETAPNNVVSRFYLLEKNQRAQYVDAALAAQGGA
jgi:hypothetical protein